MLLHTQSWPLHITESAWLGYMRVGCLLVIAAIAGWVVAFTAGAVGVSGWWGAWLWPWPLLLYLTWALACLSAPLIPSPQRLSLTADGELGDDLICHSLRSPWLIALRLRQQLLTTAPQTNSDTPPARWVWVCRDQLSAQDWTRLNRVCQSTASRPDQTA